MNTSFSKKRHIIEANQRLEDRYLRTIIFEQDSNQTDDITSFVNNVFAKLVRFNPDEMEIVNLLRTSNFDKQKFQDFVAKYKEIKGREFEKDMASAFQENSDVAEIELLRQWLKSIGLDMIKQQYMNSGRETYRWVFSGNTETNQVAQGWEKYPCVPKTGGALFVKENNAYLVNKVFYYNNGTYQTQDQLKKGKYSCNRNGGISFNNWVNCTDNYKLNCVTKSPSGPMSTDIGKLQSCLGFTGKSVDGYFGKKTETALHNKFPAFKGKVVTKTDINTICSGSAGTAGTSGTAGVTNNQIKQMTADDTPPGA